MILHAGPCDGGLKGELQPPGDKSISHRALILSTLAKGKSEITGLLRSTDTLATLAACQQLGAEIHDDGSVVTVEGLGEQGLSRPERPLDMGNSGTAMRLFAGVLAGQPFDSVLVGDDSLSQRPMKRIIRPLHQMGGNIQATEKGTAPLRISQCTGGLTGIDYQSPVASAQIKTCLLLAGLYARGVTRVKEPMLSRDHTERMLPAFAVPVADDCSVSGPAQLRATNTRVPADISSAAFFMAAASMIPDSDITLLAVNLNPSRTGMLKVLRAMGADLVVDNERMFGNEPVGDIHVRYQKTITGIDIPPEWVPSLIDEFPIIMALAAVSQGVTRIRGAEELRVKESDRIAVMAVGLRQMGVAVSEYPDGMDIVGGEVLGGCEIESHGDHRCAMSFAILAQIANQTAAIKDAEMINTSYPGFEKQLQGLGGHAEYGGSHADG